MDTRDSTIFEFLETPKKRRFINPTNILFTVLLRGE